MELKVTLLLLQLRTKYSSSNCPNHVRRTKSSIKKRIIIRRTTDNGGATDIVSVLHSSWDSNCVVVAAQCRTDTALTSCCSGGGPRQPWSSGLASVSRSHSSVPLFPLVPVLIGILASVDVKLQKLTHTRPFLTGRSVCSPNILRTVRRTMIRFLIELLVRRT